MRALVIGGTGPTGPGVVSGLADRGYEVTIYHRGTHETPELTRVDHHRHGDPDNLESLTNDFGASSWDLVVSMYGRLRYIAQVMAGRTARFIAIGGKGGNVPPARLPFPEGRALPRDESHPRVADREGNTIGWAVAQTERDVFARHAAGDFNASMLRYTDLYGPRVPRQWLWPIVRRILDGRSQIIVPGDGSQLRASCYVSNASQQVLTLVDAEVSAGRVFHAVDGRTLMLRDVIRVAAEELGAALEPVYVTHPLASALAASYATAPEQFDTAALRALGHEDPVEPAEGIRRTVRWLADHRSELDEDQLAGLVPNPYAYETEDALITAVSAWNERITADIPMPEVGRALGPGFRAGYGGRSSP
jgi:nucleoside-diphosphate-sugar epimerase